MWQNTGKEKKGEDLGFLEQAHRLPALPFQAADSQVCITDLPSRKVEVYDPSIVATCTFSSHSYQLFPLAGHRIGYTLRSVQSKRQLLRNKVLMPFYPLNKVCSRTSE